MHLKLCNTFFYEMTQCASYITTIPLLQLCTPWRVQYKQNTNSTLLYILVAHTHKFIAVEQTRVYIELNTKRENVC